MACCSSCSYLGQCSAVQGWFSSQNYKQFKKAKWTPDIFRYKNVFFFLNKTIITHYYMHNNYIINNTYVWSSVRCEISNSFSLPKISNHSFLTDSPQRVSSRRSMFWSRSMSETRCAKRGTTTAWTRFHKVCLSWMEKKGVYSGFQINIGK